MCQSLHDLLIPTLYQALYIPIPPTDNLAGIRRLFQQSEGATEAYLMSVRELTFTCSPLRHHVLNHVRKIKGEWSLSRVLPKSFGQCVLLVLNSLRKGHLTSLGYEPLTLKLPKLIMFCSWHNPCVPKGILDWNGYIPEHQPDIRSIVLNTSHKTIVGTNILVHTWEQRVEGLMKLRNLSALHWYGLRSRGQVMILNRCLANNSVHLKELRLSFCQQLPVTLVFALCLKRRSRFAVLQQLSLESVLFDDSSAMVLELFRSAYPFLLEVTNCEGTDYLSHQLSELRQSGRLRDFELKITPT